MLLISRWRQRIRPRRPLGAPGKALRTARAEAPHALDDEHAVCTLRDEASFHNHVGGLHAGAMFTLAETASGALLMAAFEDLVQSGHTPLAASATIAYTKLATGPVTATATFARPPAQARAELAETGRTVQTPIQVVLSTDAGETGRMEINWAIRPPR